MIELSTIATQTTPVITGTAAPGGAAGGFVQLLAAFLDSVAGAAAPADAAPASDRQPLADDGKTLPAKTEDDGDDKERDPTLLWLPVALPQPLPATPPIAVPTALAARAPADPALAEAGILSGATAKAAGRPSTPQGAAPLSGGDQSAALAATGTDSSSAATPAAPIIMPAALASTDTTGTPSAGMTAAPVSGAAPAQPQADGTARAQLPQPVAPADTSGAGAAAPSTARPASQAFAAAIAAASGHAKADQDDSRTDPRDPAAPIATAQADATARPIVQAAAGAQHAPLDLRNDHGLQGMIDRIEVLRDDADARDTRIRLVPDALGSVDIAVRRDGDTMHVRFTAENQATRTLLTDAQPRLAELAEARGVKLGQTSVDAGTGGSGAGANHLPRPAAPRPRAPASALPADADLSIDQRLA
jgi:flagellar hook-length control protein FliK